MGQYILTIDFEARNDDDAKKQAVYALGIIESKIVVSLLTDSDGREV